MLQVISLRHEFEHPQVGRRVDDIDTILDEVVGGVHTVSAEGEGPMAQLLDLTIFGDFFSLHLAYQAGVDSGADPGPRGSQAPLGQLSTGRISCGVER